MASAHDESCGSLLVDDRGAVRFEYMTSQAILNASGVNPPRFAMDCATTIFRRVRRARDIQTDH